jgi:hypothetical protein
MAKSDQCKLQSAKAAGGTGLVAAVSLLGMSLGVGLAGPADASSNQFKNTSAQQKAPSTQHKAASVQFKAPSAQQKAPSTQIKISTQH